MIGAIGRHRQPTARNTAGQGRNVDKEPDTPRRLPGYVRAPCHRRGMTTTTVLRWCSTCRAEIGFEQPECLDGHGAECPEWACVQCGEAILIGWTEPVPAALPLPSVA